MLLVFCSLNGFLEASYFTLMLLDVVNISPTIQSLVKSVTTPGPQLGIVAYLFVIMVIIYSSFALEYFESDFAYDVEYDDDDGGFSLFTFLHLACRVAHTKEWFSLLC
jgi:hypothetical protein